MIYSPTRALIGLSNLAECQCIFMIFFSNFYYFNSVFLLSYCILLENHNLILKDKFLNNIIELLVDDKMKEYKFSKSLFLLIKLFKYGTNETRKDINRVISKKSIITLTKHQNTNVSTNAVELLKMDEE